jgi:hypothetical protein
MLTIYSVGLFAQAKWIGLSHSNLAQHKILLRKTIQLAELPKQQLVDVSANQQCRLWVNGKICFVELSSVNDCQSYSQRFDIAPFLTKGENCLAVEVWNENASPTMILNADNKQFITDSTWRIFPIKQIELEGVHVEEYPNNWMLASYNDKAWNSAQIMDNQKYPSTVSNLGNYIVNEENLGTMSVWSKSNKAAIKKAKNVSGKVSENEVVVLSFQQKNFTFAAPVLSFSGGKNAKVSCFYLTKAGEVANLSAFEDRNKMANVNTYVSDGSKNQLIQPFHYQPFRYLEVRIETAAEPLELLDIKLSALTYPQSIAAKFECSSVLLNTKWANACSNYNIAVNQMLMAKYPFNNVYLPLSGSLSLSKSKNLAKQVLQNSIIQIDSTGTLKPGVDFSSSNSALLWINALSEYFYYQNDTALVKSRMKYVEQILLSFNQYIDNHTNILLHVPEFLETDHSPIDSVSYYNGNEVFISLQYAIALEKASEMFAYFDMNAQAEKFKNQSYTIRRAVMAQCWDKDKGLFVNTIWGEKTFSQETNILALKAGLLTSDKKADFIRNILNNKSLATCSPEFNLSWLQCIKASDTINYYDSVLVKNYQQSVHAANDTSLSFFYSTLDANAILRLISGISSESPGFQTIRIAPMMMGLSELNVSVPHPNGTIHLKVKLSKGKLKGTVVLPPSTQGVFIWKGKQYQITETESDINL